MGGNGYSAGNAKTYKKEHFLFDECYEHFYFLTNDYHGETLLWLLFRTAFTVWQAAQQ